MIDRITDAGQCDYYEMIMKVIKQVLSDNCLKQMRYRFTVNSIVNNIELPNSEFDQLGMKEKTYLIAFVCDLSNINMEKKQ